MNIAPYDEYERLATVLTWLNWGWGVTISNRTGNVVPARAHETAPIIERGGNYPGIVWERDVR